MNKPKTIRYTLRGNHLPSRNRDSICAALEGGTTVLFPTDTGFCYVGDPASQAVHKSFLRLRVAHPKNKPFSLLCPNLAFLAEIAMVSTPQYRILKKILPGPFTCILEKNKRTPITATSAKGNTVGIRIPALEYLDELLQHWGKPLLATSVTDAEELEQEDYFHDKFFHSPDAWWAQGEEILARHGHEIGIFVDPGVPQPLRASAIFDLTSHTPLLLRDGGWDLTHLHFDYAVAEIPKNS